MIEVICRGVTKGGGVSKIAVLSGKNIALVGQKFENVTLLKFKNCLKIAITVVLLN